MSAESVQVDDWVFQKSSVSFGNLVMDLGVVVESSFVL